MVLRTAAKTGEVVTTSNGLTGQLRDDPKRFLAMKTADLFAIDRDEVEAVQLSIVRRRFAELRPKVKVLDRLASEVGIDDITTLDDLVPLALPHTLYKSYAASDIDNGRYERLTKWLGTLSAYELSQIDLSGCDSIESWLLRIEAATPMRPVCSSGTMGKISILPRGVPEEEAQLSMFLRMFEPYGDDEHGIDLRDGKTPFLCPWMSDTGRQAFINTIDLLRKGVYPGREHMIQTVGKGRITADELKLASKLRRTEALGEELVLSEADKRIARVVADRNRALPHRMELFIEEAVVGRRGQKVVLFGFWTQIFEVARACKQKGIKAEWSPDSIVQTGGGTKGFTFPDGWRSVIDDVFPFTLRQAYGMSETTAISVGCSRGFLHPLPWGIKHVVDPDTSRPLPRSGMQSGRLLVHDLLSTSLWPTTLTADQVTINWDGGCACGRKGPYFLDNIHRLGEAGGDDKITCAKTPEAYEKLEEFALSFGPQP
jgi:hypothetical protein